MNRRQALMALTAIPGFTRVTADRVTPNSVIVIEFAERITHQHAVEIRERLRDVWPDNKVVVLGDGATLKVIEP